MAGVWLPSRALQVPLQPVSLLRTPKCKVHGCGAFWHTLLALEAAAEHFSGGSAMLSPWHCLGDLHSLQVLILVVSILPAAELAVHSALLEALERAFRHLAQDLQFPGSTSVLIKSRQGFAARADATSRADWWQMVLCSGSQSECLMLRDSRQALVT